jgi:hypothetical protein
LTPIDGFHWQASTDKLEVESTDVWRTAAKLGFVARDAADEILRPVEKADFFSTPAWPMLRNR